MREEIEYLINYYEHRKSLLYDLELRARKAGYTQALYFLAAVGRCVKKPYNCCSRF